MEITFVSVERYWSWNAAYSWLQQEKTLRGSSKFICLDTRKDGVRFTTKEFRKLNYELQEVKSKYDEIQSGIIEKILTVFGMNVIGFVLSESVILSCCEILQQFDPQTGCFC